MSCLLALSLFSFAHPRPRPGRASDSQESFKLVHIENFEPFAVAKKGKSEGLAIDIITEALARVNLTPFFVGEQQDKLEDLLVKGEVDGCAILGINPERKGTYDWSDPYLISTGALFIKSPNPPLSDLMQLEGKTIVTPRIGPLAGYIEKNFPRVKVLTEVGSYTETLQAVVEGRADAAALNRQAASVLARQLFPGQFSLPDKGFLEVPFGVGVLKGRHKSLLARFNDGLKIIISDGRYDELLKKWGLPKDVKPTMR